MKKRYTKPELDVTLLAADVVTASGNGGMPDGWVPLNPDGSCPDGYDYYFDGGCVPSDPDIWN